MYKLVAFDMDGTLLDSEKKISIKTVEAINKAIEAGKIVILNTGRCPAELKEYREVLPRLRYVNCVSGALVYDYEEERSIYESPLSEEEILRLDRDGDKVITQTDYNSYNELLRKKYDGLLIARSDINGDGFVDEKDYYALKSVIENGFYILKDENTGYEKTIDLKVYDIPFILGWCDVQTEAMLESDVNKLGLISEVSK